MNIYQCQACGGRNEELVNDSMKLACVNCGNAYRKVHNESQEVVGIVKDVREPLGIPKGSVRAFATISLAVSLFVLSRLGEPPPTLLLNLLLTCVFYYFGFRKSTKVMHLGGVEVKVKDPQPLFLPQGFIRLFLIAVFAISLLGYLDLELFRGLESFFILFFSLMGGYIVAIIMKDNISSSRLTTIIDDIKAVLLMASSLTLSTYWIVGYKLPVDPSILAAIISFYFGTRL